MFILIWLSVSVFVLYISWFFLDEARKKKHLPPGPPALPLIGSVLHMAKAHSQPHLALVKLAQKYGDVMRVKLGAHEYVVLSSMEVLNELLSKDETVDRPDHGVLNDRAAVPNTGIVTSVGESWKTKRLWMMRNFREMGFGRTTRFEETTRQVIDEFNSILLAELPNKGKVLEVDRKFPLCPAFTMWRLILDAHSPQDEADCEAFLKANDMWLENGTFGDGLLLIAPFLKHLIPTATGYTAQMELLKVGNQIAKKCYSKLMNVTNEDSVNFFYSYIIQQRKGRPFFFDEDFNLTFSDIMLASLETTNAYLRSLMLYLTLYSEKQEKLHKEITENFPKGHVFSFADLKRLPYTEAFLLEVHRVSMVATNWVPRTLTADIKFREYTLKKGTSLLPNPHSAFKSKALFGSDPDTFRPERFLDPNDPTKLTDMKKFVTPFSIGKRNCPGESLSQIVSFLTLVSTVKDFQLSCVPGEDPPNVDFYVGITSKPRPFRVLLSRR